MKEGLTIITILIILVSGLVVFFIWKERPPNNTGELVANLGETASASPTPASFIEPAVETTYFPIRDFNIADPAVNARAAVLYDKKSEKVLFAQNEDERLPIASLTKLMTAVIVLEQLDMDRIVTISVENLNVDGNGADLYQGERIFVSDLFKMLLIESSNDVALTLAGRARERGMDFVLEMNKKALELGMIDTHFNDPAGLSDEAFSTASDLIKLINYARNYDIIWETMRMKTADIASIDGKIKHHLTSTNQLLGQIPGITGGKTGFTDGAGQTMMMSVEHQDSELVSIILGTEDRFGETEKLIDWGIKAHRWQ